MNNRFSLFNTCGIIPGIRYFSEQVLKLKPLPLPLDAGGMFCSAHQKLGKYLVNGLNYISKIYEALRKCLN
jgi:hypothetical protein